MPSRAPSRCTDPTCSEMATKAGRCADHQRPPWQGRPSSQERYGLSGSAQQTLHQRILARDRGICYVCERSGATEVDHIIPIWKGGAKTDPSNLAAICASPCHQEKSKRENAERRRTRRSRARRVD